jgi:peptide deformylase
MPKPKLAPPTTRVPESGTFRSARRPLLTWPDERLVQPSDSVHPCAPSTVVVAEAMIATMCATGRVALSAPQIGELVRLICVDLVGRVVLVNPCIVQRRGAAVLPEECPSVPGVRADIERATDILVEGFEPGTGRKILWTTHGLEARWIQHEIDHLDGVLIVGRTR